MRNATRQIIVLVSLYLIQGIPLGLSAAIPLILKSRGSSYSSIAKFAVASLPFSLKLLWAPIVDSTSLPGLGRRKSWLIPTQILCGLLMIALGEGGFLAAWMGENNPADIDIPKLAAVFFFTNFLMATQDIAVDGWALEILPEDFRKHASTCNTIGQSVGFFISNQIFLVLNDPHTCNKFLRSKPQFQGLVTLGGFLRFWGSVMLMETALVCLFERERKPKEEQRVVMKGTSCEAKLEINDRTVVARGVEQQLIPRKVATEPSSPVALEPLEISPVVIVEDPTSSSSLKMPSGITESYVALSQLVKMKLVLDVCCVFLTCRLPFGVIDGCFVLKLTEAGIRKEELALISPFILPFIVLTAFGIGRMIGEDRPALSIFKQAYIARLIFILMAVGIFNFVKTQSLVDTGAGRPWSTWMILYCAMTLQAVVDEAMVVCQMAFFAQVSDVSVGGTYMTFLNTISNLGTKWPSLVCLALLDHSTLWGTDGFVVQAWVSAFLGVAWLCTVGFTVLGRVQRAGLCEWVLKR